MKSEILNQCMGCQANWPFVALGIHKVVGGYPREVIFCTVEAYKRQLKASRKQEDEIKPNTMEKNEIKNPNQ